MVEEEGLGTVHATLWRIARWACVKVHRGGECTIRANEIRKTQAAAALATIYASARSPAIKLVVVAALHPPHAKKPVIACPDAR